MAYQTPISTALLALLVLASALWIGSADAAGSDRTHLIWKFSKSDEDDYRMRVGATLATPWRTAFGADVGLKDNEEQDKALASGTQMPSPALWARFATPESVTVLGVEQMALSFRHEPERHLGQIGLSAHRGWRLLGGLRASLTENLFLPYNLENPQTARWRLEHRVRLDSERTGSFISTTFWRRERDPLHHTKLRAGQTLGGFSVTAQLEDLAVERPRHTFRLQRRLFGGLALAASSANSFYDSAAHTLSARFTMRW